MWFTSSKQCPLTVTVLASGTNLLASEPINKTLELAGPGKFHVASREIAKPNAAWSLSYSFYVNCGYKSARHEEGYLYALPTAQGRRVRVSQAFGGHFSHKDEANRYAIDFDLPMGSPVYAAREGRVVEVVDVFSDGGPNVSEEQVNVVRVLHRDNTIGEYAHLGKNILVKVGEKVKRAQLIAYSGNSGRTTGPHLHFAVHQPVDGKNRRSVPIYFSTPEGPSLGLVQGKEYRREEVPEL